MTVAVYLRDTYLFRLTARVLSWQIVPGGKFLVVLDETIFYPQGGGQPSDVGTIRSAASGQCVAVSDVRKNATAGTIEHSGPYEEGAPSLQVGETVELEVDAATRILHSRIHSAGHLMDHAIQLLDVPLHPTKGYHFPQGPNTEYTPASTAFDLSSAAMADFKVRLEEKCRAMIAEVRSITATTFTKDELPAEIRSALCGAALDADDVRLISFEGAPIPVPCGSTHLCNTSDIGPFAVKKISTKGGIVRISYSV